MKISPVLCPSLGAQAARRRPRPLESPRRVQPTLVKGENKTVWGTTSWVVPKPTTAQRCRSETKKYILEDLSSSELSQFKKHHLSGNLKFNNLCISQSLKLRTFNEKNPSDFSVNKLRGLFFWGGVTLKLNSRL